MALWDYSMLFILLAAHAASAQATTEDCTSSADGESCESQYEKSSLLQTKTIAKLTASTEITEAATCHTESNPLTVSPSSRTTCQQAMWWAKQIGIHSHPSWYPGMTGQSSWQTFQTYVASLSDPQGCVYPCPPSSFTTTILPSCLTEIEPPENGRTLCQQAMWWAKNIGIHSHPSWYPELTGQSSWGAFQKHIASSLDPQGCLQPCPTTTTTTAEETTTESPTTTAQETTTTKETTAESPTTTPTPCPLATDLSTITSPFRGTTRDGMNIIKPSGPGMGQARDQQIFYIDVPVGFIFSIGMSWNDFDSYHETRLGGPCPGAISVKCTDDHDFTPHYYHNHEATSQRVYFHIWNSPFTSQGQGSFDLAWTLMEAHDYIAGAHNSNDCPIGSVKIESREECHLAGQVLGIPIGAWNGGAFSSAIEPGGCCENQYQQVYFNMEPVGVARPTFRPVCRKSSQAPSQCIDGAFGLNFCSQWCNVNGVWPCGTNTLDGSDHRNTDNVDYTCSCDGCNGCQATT